MHILCTSIYRRCASVKKLLIKSSEYLTSSYTKQNLTSYWCKEWWRWIAFAPSHIFKILINAHKNNAY